MKKKLVYSVMTIIIFLQYLAPLPAVAQELLKTAAAEMTLSELSIIGETDTTVEMKLSGSAVNTQDEPVDKTIVPATPGTIREHASSAVMGTLSTNYSVSANVISLTLPANSQGDFSLTVSIDKESLGTSSAFSVIGDNQQVEAALPAVEATSEINSESTTETTTENVIENDSTTAGSTAETTESSSSAQEKALRAAEGTDIRTYFSEGTGTILNTASLKYLDDEGNELQPPVPADATVVVHYDWSIPEEVREQIQPGDFFEFHLPEQLKVTSPQSGELRGPDNEVYGTYTIDADGKVTMIFNENVTDEFDINGTFDFQTEFDTTVVTEPGDVVVTFPEEDELPPITVPVRPTTDTSISKAGKFDKTPNPTNITWTVDINQAMNELTNPQVTETWPEGVTYSSVKVSRLVMNLDGTVSRVAEELSTPGDYTVDENGNVTILGDTSEAYRLEYVTTIDDDAKPEEGGTVPFNNKAELSDDNDPTKTPAEATVTSTYGKMLEKNRTGYDSINQEFSWAIKYNYGGKHVDQSDAVITDTMSDNMDLVDGSLVIYPITFSANGTEQKGAPLTSPDDYTLVPNPNGSGFIVQFTNDVDSAYKIEYKTKVNGIVTGTTPVNNEVEVGTGQEAGGSGNAEQQNVIKSLTDVDYGNSVADYTLKINQNHYTMNNLTVHDVFDPVPGMGLMHAPGDTEGYELQIVSSSGRTLVEGTDYILTVNEYDGQHDYGFDIQFINDYAETSESFTINYRVRFDITVIDPRDPSLDHFLNDTTVNWTDNQGLPKESEDENEFKPIPGFSYNAEKSGAYNAQTKEITWRIDVNLSQNQLTNAFLNDPITGNQQYIPGSVKVYDGFTQADGTVVKENDVTNSPNLSILEPNNNGNVLHVDFPESQRTYVIEFKTSLEGQVVNGASTYDNIVTYENDGQTRNVTGKVSIKNGGSHLQKNGKQDTTDPNYMNWDLTINPSQSVLDDVVVHDYPSSNQIVDKDSIKLYGTTVAVDGTVTVDHNSPLVEGTDYEVDLITDNVTGEQEIQVRFLHQIDTAYVMEYRALISSSSTGNSDTVSNRATIDGTGSETIHQEINKNVTVQVDHSGGSASGTKGKISIQKLTASSMVLPGAHFQLWDIDKTQILREGDVDATGIITFGNLKLGQYLLVETSAPLGYTIPDDLVAGRVITISEATSQENASPLQVINQPSKVELKKTGEDNELLAGAEFRLEQNIGGIWRPVTANSSFTTNAQGILTIEELLPGNYRLIETKAPDGYILDDTPIEFTVTMNENNQVPTVTLDMINYQGAAQMLKESAEGTPLANAEFNVVDSSGAVVNTAPLVSNGEGIVTVDHLAPGDYKFVEVKAPTGYITNSQEYPFTISAENAGKPDVVEAGTAVNYQGSADLEKTGEDGNILVGAEFNVYDSNDKKVNTTSLVSDANGKVSIDELGPGDYYFKEVKAPDGYILNTQTYSFTIPENYEGEFPTIDVGQAVNYTGSVELTKVNGQSELLAGAEFSLFTEDGVLVQSEIASDANGLVRVNKLAPGRYYFRETKAPLDENGQPYVINDYPVYFTIPESADGEPEVLNLNNFQNFKGKISLTKEGEGAQTIAGAEFTLYRVNAQNQEEQVRVVTVDEDGVIDISGLPAGSYKIVETKAPTGYIINTQPIYFVVIEDSEDDPVVDPVTVPNYQLAIVGYKVDGDSEQPLTGLAGAEFEIRNEDGSPLSADQPLYDSTGELISESNKLTSDETGKIYAAGFAAGTYQLVETKAPDGYILDSTPVVFTVENQAGKPENIEIPLGNLTNYQGKFSVTKTDKFENVLSGGRFHIENEAGETQTVKDILGNSVTELSANEQGLISGSGLAPGNYFLVEDEAPEGFIRNTAPLPFTITAEGAGEPSEENGGLFVGTYINYQGKFEITKTDEFDQVLSGGKFHIENEAGEVQSIIDSTGTPITELTADDQGLISGEGLAPGNYFLIEDEAPDGFIRNTMPLPFTISTETADEPIDTNSGFFTGTYVNYQGKFEITKTDEFDQVLSGGKFHIENEAGEVQPIIDEQGNPITELTADDQGLISGGGLAPGNYFLVEDEAPEGFIKNTTPLAFSISGEGAGEQSEENSTLFLGSYINYQGKFEITKTDEFDQVLSGGKFHIENEAGEVQSIIDSTGNPVAELTADDQGLISGGGLAPGNYFLVEDEAPTGFVKNTKPLSFTITTEGAGASSVENGGLYSGSYINYQGKFVIEKVDQSDKPLNGGKFHIENEAGEIQEIIDAEGNQLTELSADGQGLISGGGLAPGNYFLVEDEAPEGFIKNTTPLPFTISEEAAGAPSEDNGILFTGTYINYLGTARLIKVNTSGQTLQGAEFTLYGSFGNSLGVYTSDVSGQITLVDLAPGNYTLKETKAPAGYQLSDRIVSFTVAETAADEPEQIELGSFENIRIPETPVKPGSGGNLANLNSLFSSTWFYIGLVIVLTAAGLILRRNRKAAK